MRAAACLTGVMVALSWMPAAFAAEDFAQVTRQRALRLPQDHGAHEKFRTEWWYVTGWLQDADQRSIGFQVTFFRSRPRVAEDNPSAFAPKQVVLAHAAISDPQLGYIQHGQIAARTGFGIAGASAPGLRVWVRDWLLQADGERMRTRVKTDKFELRLSMQPTQPALLQGDHGFSQKAPDPRYASHYYSLPHLAVSGTLATAGKSRQVRGSAWFDHEWSSALLAPGMVGWDWIGINMHDGGALMAFRLRAAGERTAWVAGVWRRPDGKLTRIVAAEFAIFTGRRWRSPRSGAIYPIASTWQLAGTRLELRPLLDDQEIDGRATTGGRYWEGGVLVLRGGREIGRGYLELTGYDKPLRSD